MLMIACPIPVRMVETVQMELMNTVVPVFLDILAQTVKQVNTAANYIEKLMSFHILMTSHFNLNT